MKIPLKNQNIEIVFSVTRVPNIKKLERELADFFSQNEIGGYEIKRFRVEKDIFSYRIIPLEPPLEGSLSSEEMHTKEIEEIGKKYGIKDLDFAAWCYGK